MALSYTDASQILTCIEQTVSISTILRKDTVLANQKTEIDIFTIDIVIRP
jgi:hypothetical protein